MWKLKTENLYKVFGDSPDKAFNLLEEGLDRDEIMKETNQLVALQDINFEVEESETFVIMGLSGSGKSTLLRCVNRLMEPTKGNVMLNGREGKENVADADRERLRHLRRHEFGMVFQNFALLPHRTVIGNVEYGLEVQDIPKKERKERARKQIDLVGLDGWEKSKTSQLSGGMQQRVGLARALAVDPEILLMDEPFSALDPLIKREMQQELIALQERVKKTVLFVTHDLDEAVKIGDRIMILNKNGIVAQMGTAKEILKNPADEYVEAFVEDLDETHEAIE